MIAQRRPRIVGAKQAAPLQFGHDVIAEILSPPGCHANITLNPSDASIAPFTERLRLLVALRPGLVAPAEAVRQAAALDRLSEGRAILNVVTGGMSSVGGKPSAARVT